MPEFSKRFEPFSLPVIVILVGLSAFGLGRLSAASHSEPRLIIRESVSTVTKSDEGSSFVASASGEKYYLPSCAGASRIKEENKIWFGNKEEAAAAGYEPAANCPGL